MKRELLMRTGNIILKVLLVISIISLCGCTNRLSDYTESAKNADSNADEYRITKLNLELDKFENGGMISPESVCYEQDYLYYSTVTYVSDKECLFSVYRYSIEKEENEKIIEFNDVRTSTSVPVNIIKMGILDNGDIALLYMTVIYDEATEADYKHIEQMIYSQTGELITKTGLQDDTAISLMANCYWDKEHNIYVFSQEEEANDYYLLEYDNNCRLIGKKKLGLCFGNIVLENGKTIASIEHGSNENTSFVYVNAEGKDNESLSILNDNPGISLIIGSEQETVYIADDRDIYSYNTETGELGLLMKCRDIAVDTYSIIYFDKVDDNRYICLNTIEVNEDTNYELLLMEKNSESGKEKMTLRIGSIYEDDKNLINAINAYNRTNEEINIEYAGYGMGSEEPMVQFNKDIAAGNIPDIYLIDEMDVNNLIAKDMLENLTPYINSDAILNKDYFVEGYLDAIAVKGNNYFLTKTFYLDTLCGYGKEVEAYKESWNYSRLAQYYKAKPEGIFLYQHSNGEEAFEKLISGNLDEFIDRDTGKCSFDNDEFKSLLEICNKANRCVIDNNDEKGWAFKIRDGEMLLRNDVITCLYTIKDDAEVFNNDACYIGYPWEGKDVGLGTYGSTFAISSQSEHKDEAWELIKYLMTGDYDKYNHDYLSAFSIPSSAKEFDMLVKDSAITKDYVADDGVKVIYALGSSSCNTALNPVGSEEVDSLKNLIKRAKYIPRKSVECEVMIPDVRRYLSGERSLIETVNIIQDKMTKYVGENR